MGLLIHTKTKIKIKGDKARDIQVGFIAINNSNRFPDWSGPTMRIRCLSDSSKYSKIRIA